MPTRPIRVGLQIQPQHADYAAIRRTAMEADDLGADVIFTWDHFYPLYGDLDGKHFECWTILAAWAEATSHAEISALVTCNGYRNPDLLADMARTIDHISGGRFILGIGAGWNKKDYDNFGYSFGTPGSRIAEFAQALPRIEARWGKSNPPPTRKIPMLIGGGGERKMLRLVAEHADIWHTFADPAVLHHKSEILRQHCSEVGRDFSEIERSVGVNLPPDATDAQMEALGATLVDEGATLFTIGVSGPDYDLTAFRKWLAWRDRQNG